MFSAMETAYIKSQRLARIGTVSPTGQPDVSVVGFEFDGASLYIGGYNVQQTRKFKNVVGNGTVAVLIDDLLSVDPWKPRGIRVYGTASVADRDGSQVIQVNPTVHWSWGIKDEVFRDGEMVVRKTVHQRR